jgi:glutamyl-tRNA reductase
LARSLNGSALGFDDFKNELYRADIVITSTSAPNFIIKKEMVKQAIQNRKNKPIFFIDIAVPRDIEPDINSLENVYLYDIDDLQIVVSANMKEREKEAESAMNFINQEVTKFNNWIGSLDAVPTIVEIRNKAENIRNEELEKALKKIDNLSETDKETLRLMSSSMVNKILHKPTIKLKEKTQSEDGHIYLKAIRHLFHLDD